MRPDPVVVVAALVESSSGAESAAGAPPRAEARLFLARRSAAAGQGGLWELPGGKVEAGESAAEALVREIREELGVGLSLAGPPKRYEAEIGGRAYAFIVFPASFVVEGSEGFQLKAHDEWRYFSKDELPGLALAPLDAPALRDWVQDLALGLARD